MAHSRRTVSTSSIIVISFHPATNPPRTGRTIASTATFDDQHAALHGIVNDRAESGLTVEELQALVTLTENQFFRIRFFDPKMPGYKARPDELKAAESAVAVISQSLEQRKGIHRQACPIVRIIGQPPPQVAEC